MIECFCSSLETLYSGVLAAAAELNWSILYRDIDRNDDLEKGGGWLDLGG